MMVWKPGDRVEVCLPDRNGVKGRKGSLAWFAGTVREIDTGCRPGVLVDLDDAPSGVSSCYATHGELHRAAGS